MSEVKLTTKKIKGADVEIFATDSGTFTATVNGERVEKPTLQQLVDRVGVMLAAKLKPMDVMLLDFPSYHEKKRPPKFRVVRLTGIHSANGNMMINTGQISRQLGYHDHLYPVLSVEEQQEYFDLKAAQEKGNEDMDAWERKHALTKEKAHKLLGIHQIKTAGVE